MAIKRVRTTRTVIYQGPEEWVEHSIANSIHESVLVCGKRDGIDQLITGRLESRVDEDPEVPMLALSAATRVDGGPKVSIEQFREARENHE